jgi:FRG domain-containing protein
MRYNDRAVVSVAHLLKELKLQQKPRQIIWFRGHADKKWALVPSLARTPRHLKAEPALLKRFMQNAVPHLEFQPQHEWEWLFLMQHHRVHTRLLDWSESPLVALYFAVTEKEHRNKPGAVWCLDPVALNGEARLKFDFDLEIPGFGIDKLDSYLPSHVQENPAELFPVAIVGARSTPRMAAQLGTFTINHRLHTPIENIGAGKHVWRWIIPPAAKERLRRELVNLGFSALTLFPELDRVADLTKELLS